MTWTTPQNHLMPWLKCLTFILLLRTTTGELERLRNCGYRDTCGNRTLQYVQPPENMDKHVFTTSPCYCDHMCQDFGDCCEDKPSKFGIVYKIGGIPRDEWTCRGVGDEESVYLVTECKEESLYAKLCSRITTNYHYMLDLPVHSINTGINYGNIFCAMCHKDHINLEPLHVKIRCTHDNITIDEIKENGDYLPGLSMWRIRNETCTVQAVRNSTLNGRKCVPSIAECPKLWDDIITRSKCENYQLLVVDKNNNVYKNPHCAVCNGVALDGISCWHNLHYRKPSISAFFPNPSLSLVMNFNWDFESCQLPEVWDGLHSKCLDISCDNCLRMSPSYDNLNAPQVERYLTFICLTISIACLIIHIGIFYTLKEPNLPAKILNSLSFSLLSSQFLFLVGVTPIIDISHEICQGIAIVVHYFFLSSFFWMNTMSFDVWRTFSSDYSTNFKSYLTYSIYAWGLPFVLVAISVIADFATFVPDEYSPLYAEYEKVCWFASRIGLVIFLYVPIWSLIIVNSILFFLTLCWFQKQNFKMGNASGRKEYTRFWLYLKLWTIMGVSWGFGMIASLANMPDFWYPFIVLNGLQGTFIFIMFDLKSNIIDTLLNKMKFNLTHSAKKEIITQSTKISSSLSCKV